MLDESALKSLKLDADKMKSASAALASASQLISTGEMPTEDAAVVLRDALREWVAHCRWASADVHLEDLDDLERQAVEALISVTTMMELMAECMDAFVGEWDQAKGEAAVEALVAGMEEVQKVVALQAALQAKAGLLPPGA